MFSSENLSKQDLIARLNVLTININSIINKLSSKELKQSLKYLLHTSSVTDPGQFSNLNKTINDAIEEINQNREKQKKLAGTFGCAIILSLAWLFKAANNEYGNSDLSFPTGLGLFSSALTGHKLYSIKNIDEEIMNLNKIKTMIDKAKFDNEKLSRMLQPEDLSFREEFYQKYIQADETAKRQEINHTNKSKGSFVLWKPAESLLPQIGFATLPELKVGVVENKH